MKSTCRKCGDLIEKTTYGTYWKSLNPRRTYSYSCTRPRFSIAPDHEPAYIPEPGEATPVVTIERRYLMPMWQIMPTVSWLAALIMTCLEIAWHS